MNESRISNSEKQKSDLEERIMEITKSGQQTGQIKKKKEKKRSNIRHLWDSKKSTNLLIAVIPEQAER